MKQTQKKELLLNTISIRFFYRTNDALTRTRVGEWAFDSTPVLETQGTGNIIVVLRRENKVYVPLCIFICIHCPEIYIVDALYNIINNYIRKSTWTRSVVPVPRENSFEVNKENMCLCIWYSLLLLFEHIQWIRLFFIKPRIRPKKLKKRDREKARKHKRQLTYSTWLERAR